MFVDSCCRLMLVFLRWMGRCQPLIGRRCIRCSFDLQKWWSTYTTMSMRFKLFAGTAFYEIKKKRKTDEPGTQATVWAMLRIFNKVRLNSFCILGSLDKVTCVFSPIFLGETNWQELAPCTPSSHRFHRSRPQNDLCSPVLVIQKPFQYLPAPAANSSKQRVKYREDHKIVSSSDRSRKVDSPRMPLALSAGSCCAMQSLSTNTTKGRLKTLRRLCQKQRKKTKTSHGRNRAATIPGGS